MKWTEAIDLIANDAIQKWPIGADLLHHCLPMLLGGLVRKSATEAVCRDLQGNEHTFPRHCSCPSRHRIGNQCEHTIVFQLASRAQTLLQGETHMPPATPGTPRTAKGTEIPAQFLVDSEPNTKGEITQFIKYAGLLWVAHQEGLQRLEVEWLQNEEKLSLAKATAVFADGRIFTERGDSTPDNVGPRAKTHWRRVSLTRAKARALRDALGIEYVSQEETE